MKNTILITGATDGIGFETAKMLVAEGHDVLLHGRNPGKLKETQKQLANLSGDARLSTYVADLSRLSDVVGLAGSVIENHARLDVLINNAGIYKTPTPVTSDGLDIRFVVNTIAPYLLTRRLLPALGRSSRVINLSSAAQSPVDLDALVGKVALSDGAAYAQSKLAITMWTQILADELNKAGIVVVAVNPGSLLATNMVREAFGTTRAGVDVGAEILCRAALSEEFAAASGQYFDNDAGRFASPHRDALDSGKTQRVIAAIEDLLAGKGY